MHYRRKNTYKKALGLLTNTIKRRGDPCEFYRVIWSFVENEFCERLVNERLTGYSIWCYKILLDVSKWRCIALKNWTGAHRVSNEVRAQHQRTANVICVIQIMFYCPLLHNFVITVASTRGVISQQLPNRASLLMKLFLWTLTRNWRRSNSQLNGNGLEVVWYARVGIATTRNWTWLPLGVLWKLIGWMMWSLLKEILLMNCGLLKSLTSWAWKMESEECWYTYGGFNPAIRCHVQAMWNNTNKGRWRTN